MISINTNLGSLIVQSNLKKATFGLNTAIERMTTGFKINSSKDNAANFSIATQLDTKIRAYSIAEENISNGLNLVSTASESLDLIEERLARMRALQEQTLNGTYGEDSLKAINSEINALVDEIERLYTTTEYNKISLFQSNAPPSLPTPKAKARAMTNAPPASSQIATESNLMSELGLYRDGEIKLNNGNNVTIKTTDKVSDVVTKLQTAGLNASFADGVFYLGNDNDNVFISEIDERVYDALGLTEEPDAYIDVLVGKGTTSTNKITYEETITVGQGVASSDELKYKVTTSASSTTAISVNSNSELKYTVTTNSTETTGLSVGSSSILTYETSSNKDVAKQVESSAALTYMAQAPLNPDTLLSVFFDGTDYLTIESHGLADYMKQLEINADTTIGDFLDFINIDCADIVSAALVAGSNYWTGSVEGGVNSEGASPEGRIYLYIVAEVPTMLYSNNGFLEALGLPGYMDNNDISVVAEGYNTVNEGFLSVPLQSTTATSDVLLSDLGLSSTTSITLSNGSVISAASTESINTLVTNLNNSGLSASFADGKFSLGTNGNDVYITNISGDLANAIKVNGSDYSQQTIITTTTTVNSSDTMAKAGLTSNASITLNTGSVINIGTNDSVSTVLSNLQGAGLNASFSDGKFSLGSNGSSTYISNISSNLSSVMKLDSNVYSETNPISVTTTYSATSTTAMSTLGLTSNGSITLNTGSVINIGTGDDVSTVLSNLQAAGLNASFSDGKFTLGSNGSTTYITDVSSNLSSMMKLNSNVYSQTNTTSNTTTHSATSTTSMNELGLTSNGSITLNNGNTINVETGQNISTVINNLQAAGLEASFEDGKIALGSNDDDTYITNLSSNLSSVMKLNSTNYSTQKVVNKTATSSDTMGKIGLTSNSTIDLNNGNSVELKTTDTISDVVTNLQTAGLKADFDNGILTLGENDSDVFITNMDSDFQTLMNLSATDYSYTKPVIGTGKVFIDLGFVQGGAQVITLQIGINADESSKITFDTSFELGGLNELREIGLAADVDKLDLLDTMLKSISKKQTDLGAVQNRLESALEQIGVCYDNLVSTRSTIRDADIAEESSVYIRNQILQQASATLLATANQTPSIALQLI